MLNRDQPWFDYETWAAETSTSKSTTFTWSHSYDGLNWPRDGRELLRVTAQRPAYWKAENLDLFDGEKWVRSRMGSTTPDIPDDDPRFLRRNTQQIKVSIRNLRTDRFITAGNAIDVDIPRLNDLPTLDGLYVAPRTLRRGDAYTAHGLHAAAHREPAPPRGHGVRRVAAGVHVDHRHRPEPHGRPARLPAVPVLRPRP